MKALALVDAPDHVCCRYRVRAFAPGGVRSPCASSTTAVRPSSSARDSVQRSEPAPRYGDPNRRPAARATVTASSGDGQAP